jgi:fructose transport system ATP-binding protein
VYHDLAVSPALDIATNLYLGRERRKPGLQGKLLRRLDKRRMREEAARRMSELGILTIQNIAQRVETLSGGQRQGVAVARAAAFGSRVVIMDEPKAALGVRESAKVLELIARVRDGGLPVDPDQPQHAPCVRSRRPDSRAATWAASCRGQP